MENVGAITFADRLLRPDDEKTEYQTMILSYIVLHELAHMWFGDLVTMEWWTDLWLKESFADFMAVTNISNNKELANYKNANLIAHMFLVNGTNADLKPSTHPIQVDVTDTEKASSVFDAICYQKGACFIRQLDNYIGEKVLKAGMHEYFTIYSYKNSTLEDFLNCLDKHAKQ